MHYTKLARHLRELKSQIEYELKKSLPRDQLVYLDAALHSTKNLLDNIEYLELQQIEEY